MLEKIAAAFTLANVYLTARQNMWCWPLGVVAVSLSIYVFFLTKLYSDAGLNVFFLVMQFYGWFTWSRGGVDHSRSLAAVKQLTAKQWGWTIAGVLGGTAVLGTAMHRYTDAALPYPDAFTTMLSVIAQFLLTRKILENWMLWILADILYVGIYSMKSLYWMAGLYVIFLALCVQGYREWKRSIDTERADPNDHGFLHTKIS
jgi:nicotinamide mononucleotide transporter